MAPDSRQKVKYVYDLPYNELKLLCRTLDFNNKWEELGGMHMKFDMMTIHELRRGRGDQRSNSPTEDLLTLWGHQNHTINELFVLLSKMQHYQAMRILKPLVDAKFHPLIYEGEGNLSRFLGGGRGRSNGEKSASAPNSSQKLPQVEALHAQDGAHGITNGSQNELPGPSNPLVDKNMNVGSHNLNVSHGLPIATANKVAFPVEQTEERKILNTPEANVSEDENNATIPSPLQLRQQPLSPSLDGAAQLPVENKENNAPQPSSLRKMSNASEASSVAESCCTIPQIAYKELMVATHGWDKNAILGKGGFGTVFKGVWKNTQVAIKRIEQRGAESTESYQAQMEQSLRELRILNACRHDNILPLYGYSMGGDEPCLVYQFMPNGSLEDRLLCRQGTKPLTWPQRHNIAESTARGLQFLHTNEKPFIHGDIKSANILLDTNFEPRIGDFGLAREGPQNHYTHMKVSRVHGTRPYLPDEFLRSKHLSTKVDTYSFGIVLFELATGLRAYDDSRPSNKLLKDHVGVCEEQQLWSLCDMKAGQYDETFMHLVVLGKHCVSPRAKDRPEMEEVLKQLEGVAERRRIFSQAQQLMCRNSPVPTNPYERQALMDYLSGLPPSTSPLPYQMPPSVSPEPMNRNMMAMGMKSGVPAMYQQPVHANLGQVSPSVLPIQNNNPFFDVNYQQRLNIQHEDYVNVPAQNANSWHKESASSCNIHRAIALPQTLPNGAIHVSPALQETQHIPTVIGSFPSRPVIAVSPPSMDYVSPILPVAITDTRLQDMADNEVQSAGRDFNERDELPLISALGIKDSPVSASASQTHQTSDSISQTSADSFLSQTSHPVSSDFTATNKTLIFGNRTS